MKKLLYITLLVAIIPVTNIPGLKAQFAAVLTKDGFIRLDNDSVIMVPNDTIRGTIQWQKSTDSLSWIDVGSNPEGDTLAFVPDVTEAYRLVITEGTCLPIYGDTVKVYSKNTTLTEYIAGGIQANQLLSAGVTLNDLLDAGLSVTELFDGGILVGLLLKNGIDSTELIGAGLIGTLSDIDNNEYNWVKIGSQIWMAENLKINKLNDNTPILRITDEIEWSNLSSPAYCWYHNDSSENANTYGALYNWYTVNTGNLCPTGWHVPSDAEWTILTEYLANNGYGYEGSGDDIAKSMAATYGWFPYFSDPGDVGNDQESNNSSGFTALPGGYRTAFGVYFHSSDAASWWTSTEQSSNNAWGRSMSNNWSTLPGLYGDKRFGYFVRCIKD
jgi:uncharacterized protein (TIGR02145 family)